MSNSRKRILALFDAVGPTTLNQDFTKELKTKDWETEANVLAALRELNRPVETLKLIETILQLAKSAVRE